MAALMLSGLVLRNYRLPLEPYSHFMCGPNIALKMRGWLANEAAHTAEFLVVGCAPLAADQGPYLHI